MTQPVSGWLPNLLGPVVIRADGVDQTPAAALDFVDCTAVYDGSGTVTKLTLTPERRSTVGPAGSGSSSLYVTDGVADEVQINAAIVAANAAGGGVVRLLPGTYYIAAPINLLSNVVLEGEGCKNTKIVVATGYSSANKWAVGAAGSLPTGTSCSLASDATQGATTIVATAGAEYTAITAGDHVFLMSDTVWETANLSAREVGEFVHVVSKASPNLTIYGMVRDSYTLAAAGRLYRVSFVESCGIRNLSISQQDALGSRTGGAQPLVSFQLCRNAFIEGCELHSNDGVGVGDMHSIGTRIESNYIHDLTDDQPNNLLGYGVIIGGASENVVVKGNSFGRMRHAIDAGPHVAATGFSAITNNGIPRGVVIDGNVSTRCANVPFSTHSEAEGWTFTGNHAEDSESVGFYMRGRSMSLVGNTVRWCSGGIHIGNSGAFVSSGGSASGSQVVGNTIAHIKSITPGSTGTNFSGYGIILAGTDNVLVSGNTISNCAAAGIRLRPYARRNVIKGNAILNANLANTANMPAIELEGNAAGSVGILTYAAGTITATGLSGLINVAVGRSIVISGAATAANNGTFTIVTVASATSVTYLNGSGATDVNNGAISWYVESASDNIFEGNAATNTAASDYDRDATGHAKYLAYDSGGKGNTRNTYVRNAGVGMETSLFSLAGAAYTSVDNAGDSGTLSSGNRRMDARQYVVPPTSTPDATPVTLLTLATVTNRNYYVTGYVQATNGGGGYWLYTVKGFYQNSGGVLTARIAAPVTVESESSASADLTANVSGTTVPIIATGIAGNVTWSGLLFVSEVQL